MKQQPHVAILAFPYSTHAPPLLSMARKLAASAPNVAFSFFNTPNSNASLAQMFASSSLDNLRIYDVSDGIPDDYVFIGKPQEDIELFMKATPENFEKSIVEAVAERGGVKVSCVVGDSFLWFSGEMAEKMGGVPWISFWTAGPCSLSVHYHTDLIRKTIGVGEDAVLAWEDIDLGFVTGLSPMRVRDLPEGVILGNLMSLFSRLLHQMGQTLPRATAVVFNTFENLDPTILNHLDSELQRCLAVGPMTLTAPQPLTNDPHGCLPWLDQHNPATVTYVSFGTVVPLPPAELTSLAEGLEASGAPFLWSLKEKFKEKLPTGFLDRTKESGLGLVVPWTPQARILEHVAVGAFVTHCGWNSVLESITGGVPMICRPFFGDQRLNGRMVSDVWGIGVGVKGGVLTKNGVSTALDVVLKKEEGKIMRSKVGALKAQGTRAAGPYGSSTKNFGELLDIISSC